MLCGLEGAKNSAMHTYTHWGYCSTVRELELERERERVKGKTQHGWGEEGKYRSAEGERGGGNEDRKWERRDVRTMTLSQLRAVKFALQ